MLSAVSTLSTQAPHTSQPENQNSKPPAMTTQDWLLGAAAVIAVVFAIALGTTRNDAVSASVAAAVAICPALVPWMWMAWLERRSELQVAWRLFAVAFGLIAAAQIAASILLIGDDTADVAPRWVDLVRVLGAGIGVCATVIAIHGGLRKSQIERTLLVPALVATGATAILLIGLAVASSRTLSSNVLDWLIASAMVTLPMSAALISWFAIVRPASQWDVKSSRLALGWTCLFVVLAGAAMDRLLSDAVVSRRTDWAMLPAAALVATSALQFLPRAVDNSGAREREAADRKLEPRGLIRELAPYVIVITAVSVAVAQLVDSRGWVSALIAGVALLVAMHVLAGQLATHTRNARAAKRLEQTRLELAARASVDPVTGLPNRRALDDRLAEEVERALRYQQPLSLCFIDLDYFKSVNDEHGHAAGDAALAQVGSILRRTARGIDFVGRFGGEEFVVLVPGTWSEDAATLGERLRRAVAESTFNVGGSQPVRLTISVGIAGLPEHALDTQSLNEHADRALYTAKRSGRNQVVLFEPGA
jgi:diguanylate cyclase (GGDEF)-like protein